jgi:predicted membrane protein
MQPIKPLSKKELREFGLLFSVLLILLLGLLIPWITKHSFPQWPWIVAAIVTTLALVAPKSLQPFYTLWMKVGLVLGWIQTRIILGFVFYVVLLPTGLIAKCFRDDPLQRKLEPQSKSYRSDSIHRSTLSMERPF